MFERAPFIRYILCLVSGILLHEYVLLPLPLSFQNTFQTVCLSLLGVALAAFFFLRKQVLASGLILSGILLLFGIIAAQQQAQRYQQAIEHLEVPYEAYLLRVKSLPEKRPSTIRYRVEVNQLKTEKDWEPVRVEAMITTPAGAAQVLDPGDVVLVKGELQRPVPPRNPEEFDYRRYLRYRRIAWTDYLADSTYQVVAHVEDAWSVRSWSLGVSAWADRTLRAYLPDDDSYALVKAMLLGRREDLRSNLVDSFTLSGAVHVLSVSGLHVGIFFAIISWSMGWLRRIRYGNYLHFGVLSLLLFFYALVTGLPPSVQRATLMCVVWVAAQTIQRRHEPVNTLAISAFVILLIDPDALFTVGFQLSYLAVLGIVLFYRPLDNLVETPNRAIRWLWQITAVSVSAQLLTFPLSIYYFHQFPLYFWLVNPFVIGLTSLLLPASLLLVFISLVPVSALAQCAGWVTNLIAYLTNQAVGVPRLLPNYLLEGLVLDAVEVVALFGLLLLVWHLLRTRDMAVLRQIVLLVVLLAIYSVTTTLHTFQEEKMVVHAVPRHSVITVKKDNSLYLFANPEFWTDTAAFEYRLNNYLIKNLISDTVRHTLTGSGRYPGLDVLPTGQGVLLRWSGTTTTESPPGRHVPDYLLITSRKYPTFDTLSRTHVVYLLGGQLGSRTRARWKELLTASGNAFYDLLEEGAITVGN
ncbi:ComEC/Rec2 family competence protein [Telluribacter sp. SYSU D00476]|uniref:ComEC/Rec2 family competence protein n=1 Tax=Telluribacter sp. SYSU D00476 TaxID=2811430 RepID=UPI001FF6A8F6|nr:ComEC/Rec2 family competence protein [Telluribacter sp. SYSU D00476]